MYPHKIANTSNRYEHERINKWIEFHVLVVVVVRRHDYSRQQHYPYIRTNDIRPIVVASNKYLPHIAFVVVHWDQ